MKSKNSVSVEQYVHSPEAQQKLYKRTLLVVVFSQIFGGAGLAAGITVGALLAQEMLGVESVTKLLQHYLHWNMPLLHLSYGRLSSVLVGVMVYTLVLLQEESVQLVLFLQLV